MAVTKRLLSVHSSGTFMAKKAAKTRSLAELEQELREKKAELAQLEKEREQLRSRLAEVDGRITELKGKRTTTRVRKKPGKSTKKRPKNKQPLKAYLIDILSKNKKGLSMPDLIEKIKESDYKTTSSNPRSVIYQCIWTQDEFVKDEKTGLYRLK